MTPDERLEAAARALCGKFWSELAWRDLSPRAQEVYRDAAREALAAAYPELSAGTHWLAPMRMTAGMESAVIDAANGDMEDTWRAARDAYLKEGGK